MERPAREINEYSTRTSGRPSTFRMPDPNFTLAINNRASAIERKISRNNESRVLIEAVEPDAVTPARCRIIET